MKETPLPEFIQSNYKCLSLQSKQYPNQADPMLSSGTSIRDENFHNAQHDHKIIMQQQQRFVDFVQQGCFFF